MPKLKKLAALIAETIVILLVVFVLAESTLRVYNHYNPSFVFYDRSYNRFRGKPGAPEYDFHLNSRGFKDVEFKTEKETGVYRIVGLGASFPFGVVPYQNNYLTLLEQRLKRDNRAIEVLNMGIPSIRPRQYLALLANEGLQLQPDMVLVSFFIGNDLTDALFAPRVGLLDRSAVVALIRYFIALSWKYEGKVINGNARYLDDAPTFSTDAYLNIERKRSLIYLKQESPTSAFADAVGYLARIKELCDKNKIALKVVIVPDELQVNPVLRAQVIKALNASPDEFDFTLPNRFLREQLSMRQIDHIDLLDAFSSASAQTNLYKPNDSHWNIAGNKLAVDILIPYISGGLSR